MGIRCHIEVITAAIGSAYDLDQIKKVLGDPTQDISKVELKDIDKNVQDISNSIQKIIKDTTGVGKIVGLFVKKYTNDQIKDFVKKVMWQPALVYYLKQILEFISKEYNAGGGTYTIIGKVNSFLSYLDPSFVDAIAKQGCKHIFKISDSRTEENKEDGEFKFEKESRVIKNFLNVIQSEENKQLINMIFAKVKPETSGEVDNYLENFIDFFGGESYLDVRKAIIENKDNADIRQEFLFWFNFLSKFKASSNFNGNKLSNYVFNFIALVQRQDYKELKAKLSKPEVQNSLKSLFLESVVSGDSDFLKFLHEIIDSSDDINKVIKELKDLPNFSSKNGAFGSNLKSALDIFRAALSQDIKEIFAGKNKTVNKIPEIKASKFDNLNVALWIIGFIVSLNAVMVVFLEASNLTLLTSHYVVLFSLMAVLFLLYCLSFWSRSASYKFEITSLPFNNSHANPLAFLSLRKNFSSCFSKIYENMSSKVRTEFDVLMSTFGRDGFMDLSGPSKLARKLGFEHSMSVGYAELWIAFKNAELFEVKYGSSFLKCLFRKNFISFMRNLSVAGNSFFLGINLNSSSNLDSPEGLARAVKILNGKRQGGSVDVALDKMSLSELVLKVKTGNHGGDKWALNKVRMLEDFVRKVQKEKNHSMVEFSNYKSTLLNAVKLHQKLVFSKIPIIISMFFAVAGILPIAFVTSFTTILLSIIGLSFLTTGLNLALRYKFCCSKSIYYTKEFVAARNNSLKEVEITPENLQSP